MTKGAGKGLYYGWIIAVSSAVMLWITNGMTLSGLTVWDEALLQTLAASSGEEGLRGALKFRDTITLLGSGLMAPLAGALADRIGVRPLMVTGLVLLAIANVLYAQVSSLGQIYGIHILLAMTLASAGLVVNVMVVSRWFVRKRGVAIGIALAGTSLGNAALPQLNVLLIDTFGWRTAFQWAAIIPLLLIPLVVFVIRERPADMGLVAPGDSAARRVGSETLPGMAYRDAVRTPNFWILSLIAMCTFYAILAMATHLFLHMRGQGFDMATAGRGVGLMFLLGLVGKISSGVLADALGRKPIFLGCLALMCAGSLLLVKTGESTFWPAIVLMGLGWGGLYTLLQLLAADYFGLRDLGKILGTITVLDALGGGLGPFLTGVLYDRFGSYEVPFMVIAGLVVVALLLATLFRTAPAAVPATAA